MKNGVKQGNVLSHNASAVLGRKHEGDQPRGKQFGHLRCLNSQRTPNKHSVRLQLGAARRRLGRACALRLGRITARAVTKAQTGRHFQGKIGTPQLTLNSCTRGPAKVEGENKGVINHTLPACGTAGRLGAPHTPTSQTAKQQNSGVILSNRDLGEQTMSQTCQSKR